MSSLPTRALTLFGLLSLIAVAIGCGVARANDVPPGVWIRNPASWCAGALLASLLAWGAGPRTARVFLTAAPVGLLATLFGAGQLGVHRWLDIGPLHMNAAQVFLPPAIVACAAQGGEKVRPWAAAVMMGLLILQPDASQATAFGAALVVLIGASRFSRPARAAGVVAIGVAIAVSWLRPDPLAPVPEVEGVIALAWTISPLLAIAAGITLAAAVGAFALFGSGASGSGGRALCAYAAIAALISLVAPFPVPLVGMAMSPIIGLWLGAGLLAAQARPSAYTPAALAA